MEALVNAALRVKLEAMTAKNEQPILQDNAPGVPSDRELFAGDVHIEPPLGEVFAGDTKDPVKEEDSHLPTDSTQAALTQQSAGVYQIPMAQTGLKRFSPVQKALAGSIIAIAVMLLYTLLKSPSGPVATTAKVPAEQTKPVIQQAPSPKPPAEKAFKSPEPHLPAHDARQEVPRQIQKSPEGTPPDIRAPVQPLSLKAAQDLYLQKDYQKAYAAYEQLRKNLPTGTEEQLLRDFLQLKMAFCMEGVRNFEQAGNLFRTILESRSPVVRTLANYHLSLIAMQEKQYLAACSRAYKTIALIGAVDFGKNWAALLQRDCYFLVAELMTMNVLSLCDADKDLPEDLWSHSSPIDPFTNLSEEQLRSLLNSGLEQLNKGLLAPVIRKLEQEDSSSGPQNLSKPTYWFVVCHGASFEELMARFAVNSGLDIKLAAGETAASGEIKDSVQAPFLQAAAKWDVCKRPVTLYLPTTTTSEFVTVAAGCVDLLARLDNQKSISIFNPSEYSSLSEHISLLTEAAISHWQRLLLMFYDDKRVPKAHFALGLLQTQKGRVADAFAEYKLVATRFSQTSLAPFALLHLSRLKVDLRDYLGARQDLKQLIEQYPDTNISGQTYLYLADATMKAQLYNEAEQLYRKIYNLNVSPASQIAATLGAGKCLYKKENYEGAAKWLNLYTKLATDRTGKDLYSAYFLLGKSNLALGKPQEACDAFQYAMAGPLSGEEYVEIVSALVKAHIEQEHFIEALDTLEKVHSYPFSQKESVEILLLRSETLRLMGLVDKAISTLGDRGEYVPDPQLKAKISFELTKCYIAKGELELACRKLSEILVLVEPGPLSHEVSCELADVCLKLGQDAQTISICRQLLDLGPSAKIKQRALNILTAAYNRQKNYENAASALLGHWNKTETPNEKVASDQLPVPDQSYIGTK